MRGHGFAVLDMAGCEWHAVEEPMASPWPSLVAARLQCPHDLLGTLQINLSGGVSLGKHLA